MRRPKVRVTEALGYCHTYRCTVRASARQPTEAVADLRRALFECLALGRDAP
jgi:hypothetical protein